MADISAMIQTEARHVGHTAASPVNVLFVDCEAAFVQKIAPRLIHKKLSWQDVSFSEFQHSLESRTIIGSVVFGPSVVPDLESDTFVSLLKTLQSRHIAVFFRGCELKDAAVHPLTCVMTPETEHEMPARLETAAQYARQYLIEQRGLALENDLTEQLEMAGQVQRNFLPLRLPHTEHVRWAAAFRPAQWVSGDIYDIVRLDETHIGFYLADAVGHSMPAALLTIFLKQATVMRQTVGHDYRIFEPAEVIAELNRRMAQQEFAGCLFATCCYGLLNIETLELKLARAGHPYPVLVRGGTLSCLQSRGGLLGVFGEAQFEQISLTLQPGDKLFVYSDGGEPLIGTPKDDGTLAFGKPFQAVSEWPIDKMIQAYDQMAQNHHFGPGEIDDVTAVGLEILP